MGLKDFLVVGLILLFLALFFAAIYNFIIKKYSDLDNSKLNEKENKIFGNGSLDYDSVDSEERLEAFEDIVDYAEEDITKAYREFGNVVDEIQNFIDRGNSDEVTGYGAYSNPNDKVSKDEGIKINEVEKSDVRPIPIMNYKISEKIKEPEIVENDDMFDDDLI